MSRLASTSLWGQIYKTWSNRSATKRQYLAVSLLKTDCRVMFKTTFYFQILCQTALPIPDPRSSCLQTTVITGKAPVAAVQRHQAVTFSRLFTTRKGRNIQTWAPWIIQFHFKSSKKNLATRMSTVFYKNRHIISNIKPPREGELAPK